MRSPKSIVISPVTADRPQLRVRLVFSPSEYLVFSLKPDGASMLARALLKALSGPGEKRLRLVK